MNLDKLKFLIRNRDFLHTRVLALFLVICIGFTLVLIWPFLSSMVERYHRSHYGLPKGVQMGNLNLSGYYQEEVRNLLLEQASTYTRWPKPANLSNDGIITPEIWGQILDLSATMELVKSAKTGENIEPVFVSIKPSLTSREILALTRPIGIYQTFIGGTENRYSNIKLAGKMINFTLLMPGEIFSFNHLVGPPSKERGFLQAPIIIDDELVPGYGGGICQVSSTLYNAALEAGFKNLRTTCSF